MTAMAATTLRTLPPPLDGVLDLIGDSTLKEKRGQQHPLGHTTRQSEHAPYTFGFEMVLLMASWDHFPEAEEVVLLMERRSLMIDLILLDERAARNVAHDLGLPMTGFPGGGRPSRAGRARHTG